MSKKIKKTNAMRQLDQAHIAYEVNTFEYDEEDVPDSITIKNKQKKDAQSIKR